MYFKPFSFRLYVMFTLSCIYNRQNKSLPKLHSLSIRCDTVNKEELDL